MLPRAERLTKSGLFQRLHSARKVISTPLLSLYVLERQPRSAARPPLVGFVVGKKVHNRAVQRNRIKRRLREAYRLLRKQLNESGEIEKYNLHQWYALAWHVKPEALSASFSEISDSVAECLEKAAQRFGRKIKSKKDDQAART
jgi:ribonuclease P protein component